VEEDQKDGDEAGVNGTPAFFINGRMLSGAQPFDAFKKIIDEELALKEKR
jgi:protein-disulfide isomerase